MAVLSRSGYGYPRPGALFGLIAKLSHRQSLGKRVVGEVTTGRDSSARHGRSASEGRRTRSFRPAVPGFTMMACAPGTWCGTREMAQGGACRDREDQVSAIAERAIGDRIIGDSFFREGSDALPVSEPTTPPTVDLDDTDAPRSILMGDCRGRVRAAAAAVMAARRSSTASVRCGGTRQPKDRAGTV